MSVLEFSPADFLPRSRGFYPEQRGDSESSLRNIRWAALLTTIATSLCLSSSGSG